MVVLSFLKPVKTGVQYKRGPRYPATGIKFQATHFGYIDDFSFYTWQKSRKNDKIMHS